MILGGRGLLGAKFGQFVNTWVSPDRKKTKIALICKNVSGTRFLEVSREIEARVSREYPDWNVLVAGPPVLNDAMTFVLIRTQISSLLLAFGSVLLVLCLLFRSFKIGLIALVPIALSTAFVYALMGLFGVAINAITVIIVNTCIGIGIDYAIHFAAGYLYVRGDYEDRMDALMATVRTKGSVIMFNTGVVGIGFLVLAFSSFPPIRDFGVFVFLSMVASSTFSLVFLPILFRLLRVEGKKSATRDTF
jgi:predicted RND superfamily exporter protein